MLKIACVIVFRFNFCSLASEFMKVRELATIAATLSHCKLGSIAEIDDCKTKPCINLVDSSKRKEVVTFGPDTVFSSVISSNPSYLALYHRYIDGVFPPEVTKTTSAG